MLDMVDVEYIRKLKLVQHWSIRQIASRLDISRNTVTKYLSAPDPTPRYRLAIPRPRPVLGAFEGVIRLWLDEDKKVVGIKENFKPFSFTFGKKAKYVLELENGVARKTRTEIGDKIGF